MSTFNFKKAVRDYRLLRNLLYPAKAALQLVGDRYRLTAFERNCLLRGVAEKTTGKNRLGKKLKARMIRGKALGIDWFNILITVESYLKGACLFLSDDGVVRDASQIHGSYRPSRVTDHAISLVIKTLFSLRPRHIDVFIDSPISHSKKMRDELYALLSAGTCPFSLSLALLASADYPLKSYPDIVATSDSVVIDSCRKFIDLAAEILWDHFSFKPVALEKLVFGNRAE